MLFILLCYLFSFVIFGMDVPQVGREVTFDDCLSEGICNVVGNCSFSVGDGGKTINKNVVIMSATSASIFSIELNGSFSLTIQSGFSFNFSKVEVCYT
jgi:hypothetical protein